MNLKPLGDRLIVEPIEGEDMTPSGIVLPETAKESLSRHWFMKFIFLSKKKMGRINLSHSPLRSPSKP